MLGSAPPYSSIMLTIGACWHSCPAILFTRCSLSGTQRWGECTSESRDFLRERWISFPLRPSPTTTMSNTSRRNKLRLLSIRMPLNSIIGMPDDPRGVSGCSTRSKGLFSALASHSTSSWGPTSFRKEWCQQVTSSWSRPWCCSSYRHFFSWA